MNEPSILSFHHVGVLVRDIDTVADRYRTLLPIAAETSGHDLKLGIRWLWLTLIDGPIVEFISPVGDGPVRKWLENHGEGLHHISFEAVDFDLALQHMHQLQATVIGLDRDHGGWSEFFLNPGDMGGVLLQVGRANRDPVPGRRGGDRTDANH